jgi:hypothetical protein
VEIQQLKIVEEIIQRLNQLLDEQLVLEDEGEILQIREIYEELPEEKKELVSNYHLLVSYEAQIQELKVIEEIADSQTDVPRVRAKAKKPKSTSRSRVGSMFDLLTFNDV